MFTNSNMSVLALVIIVVALFVGLRMMNKRIMCSIDSGCSIVSNDLKEGFATSHGTVLQLTAKGRHDQYLTGPHAGKINPLESLLPESTKTRRLPYFYVGWYPGKPDYRRRFQYV